MINCSPPTLCIYSRDVNKATKYVQQDMITCSNWSSIYFFQVALDNVEWEKIIESGTTI